MLLSLQGVSKRFQSTGGERVALDCVSLEVARGEIVGVFGPSGRQDDAASHRRWTGDRRTAAP